MKRSKWKLVIRRTVLAALILLVGWKTIGLLRSGVQLFSFQKMFSLETFLTVRVDPVKMMEDVTQERVRTAVSAWKDTKVEIQFIPEEEPANNMLVQAMNEQIATIFFYYRTVQEREQPLRIYTQLKINKKMALFSVGRISDFLRPFSLPYEAEEEIHFEILRSNIDVFNTMNGMIRAASSPSPAFFQKMRANYPHLAYSDPELASLFSTSGLFLALSSIGQFGYINTSDHGITLTQQDQEMFEKLKQLSQQPLYAYSLYFKEQHGWICWLETIRTQLTFLLSGFIIIALSFHFIRIDLDTLLDQELERRGITMTWKRKMRILISNWRLFLLTAPKSKLQHIAKRSCDKYQDWLKKQVLAQDAEELWKLLSDHPGIQSGKKPGIEKLYAMAKGMGSFQALRYPDREKAYHELQRWEHRFHQALASAGSPLVYVPDRKKKSKRRATTSRRQELLLQIGHLIPPGFQDELHAWSSSDLENLSRTVFRLRKENGPYLRTFWGYPTPRELLRDEKFMGAIQTRDKPIIAHMLGIGFPPKQEAETKPPVSEQTRTLPSHLTFVIVGGGKLPKIRNKLIAAITELGPSHVLFKSPENLNEFRSTLSDDPNRWYVVFWEQSSHDTDVLLKTGGANFFYVRSRNPSLFQQEVLNHFHQA